MVVLIESENKQVFLHVYFLPLSIDLDNISVNKESLRFLQFLNPTTGTSKNMPYLPC